MAEQLVAVDRAKPLMEVYADVAADAATVITSEALRLLEASIERRTSFSALVTAMDTHAHDSPDRSGPDRSNPDPLGPNLSDLGWSMTPWVSLADELDAAILGASLWEIDGEGFGPLALGFEREYERARAALAEIDPDAEPATLGELMARVTTYHHHLCLLWSTWPKVMKPLAKEVRRLGRLLKRQQELSRLRSMLLSEDDPNLRRGAMALAGVITEDQCALADRTAVLIARLFADEPPTASHRMATWWAAANV